VKRSIKAAALAAVTVVVTSIVFFCKDAASASSPVTTVGEFSNMRHTAEHTYGYSVQLWRSEGMLFGLFLAANGLEGDTPTGVLEDVKYSVTTGKLSFKSKLSVGFIYTGSRWVPSHDLFEFDGSLSGNGLNGGLKHFDMLHTEVAPEPVSVHLKRVSSESMVDAPTYEEWQRATQAILVRRGPKW